MATWIDYPINETESRPALVIKPGAANRREMENGKPVNHAQDAVMVFLLPGDQPLYGVDGSLSLTPIVYVDAASAPTPVENAASKPTESKK